MEKNYAELTKRISGGLRKLRKDIPDTLQAFSALAQAATRDGVLDKKTKELIALARGGAARCDGFYLVSFLRNDTPQHDQILAALQQNTQVSATTNFSLKSLLFQRYVPWLQ